MSSVFWLTVVTLNAWWTDGSVGISLDSLGIRLIFLLFKVNIDRMVLVRMKCTMGH